MLMSFRQGEHEPHLPSPSPTIVLRQCLYALIYVIAISLAAGFDSSYRLPPASMPRRLSRRLPRLLEV